MNLLNFIQNFPDEESCIAHFKAQRDQIGVVCPKCGSKEHIWLKGKLRYECKHCHYRPRLWALADLRVYSLSHCTKVHAGDEPPNCMNSAIAHRRVLPAGH